MASTEHLAIAERGTTSGSVLTLRQLSTNNGFVRVIKCTPGMITIIEDDAGGGVRYFRDALLGRTSSSKVNIRFGDRELHASEIQVIAGSDYLSRQTNVKGVLSSAGAPESAINSLLRATGLEKPAAAGLIELTDVEARRLAIACALYSKAKVLYFDKPFQGVSSDQTENLAVIMLRTAIESGQIYIVTGIEKLPLAWKAQEDVQFESILGNSHRGSTFGSQKSPMNEVVQTVRSLLQATRPVEEQGPTVLTRPQKLSKPSRTGGLEGLQTEMITNPHLLHALGGTIPDGTSAAPQEVPIKKEGDTATRNRDTSIRRRKDSLTSVSTTARMYRKLPILKNFIALREQILARINGPSKVGLSNGMKYTEAIRRRKARHLAILVTAGLTAIVFLTTL